MSANPFLFKEFSVSHDKCAMKLTTEACLFGALIDPERATSILDIGAGCGIISLMLAQRSNGYIDAVEVHKDSFDQCAKNFFNSNWSDRLHPVFTDFLKFNPKKKYDLIVSNPPFYENQLKSKKDKNINLSRHSIQLSKLQLVEKAVELLNETGKFWILLPQSEFQAFIKVASEYELHLNEKIEIYSKVHSRVLRIIGCLSKEGRETINISKLIIHSQDRNYTTEYKSLMKPFYLDI